MNESELVEMAKLAEQAERYDDMVKYMTELTERSPGLPDEQRNLLSVAFKNVVGARRSAWRITSSMEARFEEKKEDKDKVALAVAYKMEIEKELEVLKFNFKVSAKWFVFLNHFALDIVIFG